MFKFSIIKKPQVGTEDFDKIYQQVTEELKSQKQGLVVVASSNDAFIDPIALTLVSPQFPYLGVMRSEEDARTIFDFTKNNLAVCSMHVYGTKEDVVQRLKDFNIPESEFENTIILTIGEENLEIDK